MDNELYEALGILVEASEQYADYLYDLTQENPSDTATKSYEQFINGIDGATITVGEFLNKAESVKSG